MGVLSSLYVSHWVAPSQESIGVTEIRTQPALTALDSARSCLSQGSMPTPDYSGPSTLCIQQSLK